MFDRLTDQVTRARSEPVLTHGEPHPDNIITTDNGLFLIDWDTVGLAVPERDLWLVHARHPDTLDLYAA